MNKTKRTVIILIVLAILIAIIPLVALKGADFVGSDDAGSQVVSDIEGKEYTPWFTPVLETLIGGEIPGEIECLIFCIQTGIGVGVIAFFMGRFVERTKIEKRSRMEKEKKKEE